MKKSIFLTVMVRTQLFGFLIAAWLCLGFVAPAVGQGKQDLIKSFNAQSQVVSGDWKVADGELTVSNEPRSRAVLAKETPQSYSLTIEFTRTSGNDAIGIILPVGSSQCAFIMSAFKGEAHGIGIVDGELAKQNKTSIKPGTLETDHPYRLLIEVDVQKNDATISSTLDGRKFLNWAGNVKSLSMIDIWKLPATSDLGLFTFAETTFHRISLRKLDPAMRMTGPAPKPEDSSSNSIQFENKTWSAPNAESIAVESYQGKSALHIQGEEANYVFLGNSKFKDGTIEVDIASDTFSGIGFRGNNQGSVVEKIYFRPFNSGTAKHDKTVQYSMLGPQEFTWRALRASFPGKYESGADIKPGEWFHLKVEIKGESMKAFVNDGKNPVLTVENLLSDQDSGTIGVWGWDSYFANYRFTPSGS